MPLHYMSRIHQLNHPPRDDRMLTQYATDHIFPESMKEAYRRNSNEELHRQYNKNHLAGAERINAEIASNAEGIEKTFSSLAKSANYDR